ncbi:snRNA-activating protein complex subunit 5 isoform X2 [Carettochelys insculpta]|uniref:snRNA-activating protein complex subunit 5 isoform X2 n=1 Tax=Carettochelys insculpta TaxID=44489 RepID=UPI003EBC159C
MLSRLQELRKEEETLLRVEELALQSLISSREKNVMVSPPGVTEETQNTLRQMDNEAAINQTELQLNIKAYEEEEEEEDDESDS